MSASIYPEYPPSLTDDQLSRLILALNDWTAAHGLLVRQNSASSSAAPQSGADVATAPVTLFPSPFPSACFDEGLRIQTSYNALYAAIASDEAWLTNIMKELVTVDDFIEKLWDVHLKVKEEGYAQHLSLGLFRSDYMVHVDPSTSSPQPTIKQVEFNTIASSFGGLSSRVSQLHKYLHATKLYPEHQLIASLSLPPNPATTKLATGIVKAHKAYGSSRSKPELPLCVLFVVQDPEGNVFDQRHLEYAIQESNVPVFRLPFSKTLDATTIPKDNNARPLIYTPPQSPKTPYEASVLYFRASYTPRDYENAGQWAARYHLERSAAIKCPSILTHLAGTKKVQQVLATPSSPDLARFVPDEVDAAHIRKTFAAIYPLDDSEAGRHAKTLATSPESSVKYVLKPQREGGGNNIYRAAIPEFLRQLGREENWRGHILMEIIEPPLQQNSLLRAGEVHSGEVIAEFGVFGTCLWGPEGVMHNAEAGYLLRTKGRESEEGGVAAGFGAVDSACLVDV